MVSSQEKQLVNKPAHDSDNKLLPVLSIASTSRSAEYFSPLTALATSTPHSAGASHLKPPTIKITPPTPNVGSLTNRVPFRSSNFFKTDSLPPANPKPPTLRIFSTPLSPPPPPSQVFPLIGTNASSPMYQTPSGSCPILPCGLPPPPQSSRQHAVDFFQNTKTVRKEAPSPIVLNDSSSPSPPTPLQQSSDFFKPVKTEPMDVDITSLPSIPPQHAFNFFTSIKSESSPSPLPLQHAFNFFKSVKSEPTPSIPANSLGQASDFFKSVKPPASAPVKHASEFFKHVKMEPFASTPRDLGPHPIPSNQLKWKPYLLPHFMPLTSSKLSCHHSPILVHLPKAPVPVPLCLTNFRMAPSLQTQSPWFSSPLCCHLCPGPSTLPDDNQLCISMEDWPVVQPFVPEFSKFVFNTDDLLATQQTEQSWWRTRRAAEWILSHEELQPNTWISTASSLQRWMTLGIPLL